MSSNAYRNFAASRQRHIEPGAQHPRAAAAGATSLLKPVCFFAVALLIAAVVLFVAAGGGADSTSEEHFESAEFYKPSIGSAGAPLPDANQRSAALPSPDVVPTAPYPEQDPSALDASAKPGGVAKQHTSVTLSPVRTSVTGRPSDAGESRRSMRTKTAARLAHGHHLLTRPRSRMKAVLARRRSHALHLAAANSALAARNSESGSDAPRENVRLLSPLKSSAGQVASVTRKKKIYWPCYVMWRDKNGNPQVRTWMQEDDGSGKPPGQIVFSSSKKYSKLAQSLINHGMRNQDKTATWEHTKITKDPQGNPITVSEP